MQLGLAFVAGLILNVMPCVLPVIGLKIMSFVHQAGHHRGQVFLLNLWYVAGLMAVFLLLAVLTVQTGQGWGAHFQSTTFTIVMASIVFVCALSFLGVWEIPIPGFVGSSTASELAAKEGALGAFAKGVLTTVLATPCTGPFLVPAITWALSQPPVVVYAVFLAVGLGMASPYLVIGAFPQLVSRLPKPGPWMETFKQLMGFVLLGTVVFILNSFQSQPEYYVPVLAFLFGLWAACWWIGRSQASHSHSQLRAWGVGTAVAVLMALF
jgi:thiol:disulfide interchange protein